MEETIVLLLIISVFISLLRASLWEHWLGLIAGSLVVVAFSWFMFPLAIEQNNTFLRRFIENDGFFLNLGALTILEALLFLYLVLYRLKQSCGYRRRLHAGWRWLMRILQWYPGLTAFGALFYLEVWIAMKNESMDFDLLAGVMTISTVMVTCFAFWFIRMLLPEKELRLEITCFLLLLQLLLVFIVTSFAGIKGYRLLDTNSVSLPWKPCLACLALLMLCASIGYQRYMRQTKAIIEQKMKH